ncbi:acyl-CoA dehydrogenase family protein [Streptomyces sp. 8N616]|uniref:acyl-CoA dehydrogenase family protein n=1 Tax=Streptomyces sp. 8N616 TaxID=3457414 RepID=UPI003FD0A79B
MDFRLTEDQEAVRKGFRELLAGRFPRGRLRAAVDGGGLDIDRGFDRGLHRGFDRRLDRRLDRGLDRGLWRELGEAGFFALRLAEEEGGVGVGLGLPEAVLVFEEAGRALLPGPLVATHLAAGLVEGAATGEAVVTAVDISGSAGGPVAVEHLASADALLVVDDVDGVDGVVDVGVGVGVNVLRPDGVEAAPMRSVDPATPLHRVVRGVERGVARVATREARRAGGGARTPGGRACGLREAAAAAAPAAGRLRREAALLTAAQQLGSASRTVEMAVQYAGEREQFGQPIGAFQAVKHLCAQMLVRAEIARSAVYAAAVTGVAYDTAAAKLLADEAAVRNARDCLQVHGGMGFTWEADVHLHLKRAWVRAAQWQSAAEAEDVLAEGLAGEGCPGA